MSSILSSAWSWTANAASAVGNAASSAYSAVGGAINNAGQRAAQGAENARTLAADKIEGLRPQIENVQAQAAPLAGPMRIMQDPEAEQLVNAASAAVAPVIRLAEVLETGTQSSKVAKAVSNFMTQSVVQYTKPKITTGIRYVIDPTLPNWIVSNVPSGVCANPRTIRKAYAVGVQAIVTVAVLYSFQFLDKIVNNYFVNTSSPAMIQDGVVFGMLALMGMFAAVKACQYASHDPHIRTSHLQQDQTSIATFARSLQGVSSPVIQSLSIIPASLVLLSFYGQFNLHPDRPDLYLNPGLSGSLLMLTTFLASQPQIAGQFLEDLSSLITLPLNASRASHAFTSLITNPTDTLIEHHTRAMTIRNGPGDLARTELFSQAITNLGINLNQASLSIKALGRLASKLPQAVRNPLDRLQETATRIQEATRSSLKDLFFSRLGAQINNFVVPVILNLILTQIVAQVESFTGYPSGTYVSSGIKLTPIILSWVASFIYMKGLYKTYHQSPQARPLNVIFTDLTPSLAGDNLSLLERASLISKVGSSILYHHKLIPASQFYLAQSLASRLTKAQKLLGNDWLTPWVAHIRRLDATDFALDALHFGLDRGLGVSLEESIEDYIRDNNLQGHPIPYQAAQAGALVPAGAQMATTITAEDFQQALQQLWASTAPRLEA